jgi:hypothetical protein
MDDRDWMYLKNQNCNEYLDNLKLFIKAAEADKMDKSKSAICCPCVDCKKTRWANSMDVYAHLIIRGFMSDYRCWNMHGEGGLNDRDLQAGHFDQHSSEDLIFEHEQNTGEDGDSGDGDEGYIDFQGHEANLDS